MPVKGITVTESGNGRFHVRPTIQTKVSLTCDYWETDQGGDRWRYQFSDGNGPWSHPSQYGCEIAARKYFIEKGAIIVPNGFDHLNETDKIIAGISVDAFNALPADRPRVGDYLRLAGGNLSRATHAWDEGMQIGGGKYGSYYLMESGHASYSGGLDPSILWECWQPSNDVEPGQFWFFSEGRAGAGRGVEIMIPCRVFDYLPITMTEEQARAHPAAIRSAKFWGDGHREHLGTVGRLMNGGNRPRGLDA